jgi:thiol-disulfide isomerase/thioredoxin
MLERLLVAIIISGVGVALWIAYNRWSVLRTVQVAERDPLLTGTKRGIPTIVYFTTPFCEPCRTLQQPTLSRLELDLAGAVQIIKIDATAQPEAADRWGVFSAPTTFVLDRNHQPRHVNRGVTSLETLKKQLVT